MSVSRWWTAAVVWSCCVGSLLAGDKSPVATWPQWRGPHQNGSIRMGGLPATVGADTLRWSTPLPGKAGSTPVVLPEQTSSWSSPKLVWVLVVFGGGYFRSDSLHMISPGRGEVGGDIASPRYRFRTFSAPSKVSLEV